MNMRRCVQQPQGSTVPRCGAVALAAPNNSLWAHDESGVVVVVVEGSRLPSTDRLLLFSTLSTRYAP